MSIVYAEETQDAEASSSAVVENVQQQLHLLLGRIAGVLTKTEAKVVYESALDNETKHVIAEHLEHRIDWLEITDRRLFEADSLHEIARIHRDVQAFMAQPPRPPMGKVVGRPFEAHLAHCDQAIRRGQLALEELEEGGVEISSFEGQLAQAQKAVDEAETSYWLAQDSEDPALWRIVKEDHRQAKEAVQTLLEELFEARVLASE